MECSICGRTTYWCQGHAPYRFETEYGTAIEVAENRWRFRDVMDTTSFGSLVVQGPTYEVAVAECGAAMLDGRACWKR